MMPKLHVVITSTRPTRQGPKLAAWFLERARRHAKFDVELVDLAEVNLPLFDEPKHPRFRQYEHEHTRRWSAIVERADAFAFVQPEYNHGPPPSLLNAIDYLVHEWAYKPLGFVSYGGVSGGIRSVQMIKLTANALKMVPLVEAVNIPFFGKLIDQETGRFTPDEGLDKAADLMLDELLRWTGALATLRK